MHFSAVAGFPYPVAETTSVFEFTQTKRKLMHSDTIAEGKMALHLYTARVDAIGRL